MLINHLLNNELFLPITTAVLLLRYGVPEAAPTSPAKAGEQFLRLLLPPGKLAVTFRCVGSAFAVQKPPEQSPRCCRGTRPRSPRPPRLLFHGSLGQSRAGQGREPAATLQEKTGGHILVPGNPPSLRTVDVKSSLHAELIFASRQTSYRRKYQLIYK